MADEPEEKNTEPTVSDTQLMSEVNARDAEVTKLLNKREFTEAFRVALQNPPIAAKGIDVKDANARILEKVLAMIPESNMKAIVDELDMEACDVLMKYVYRFMSKSTNCSSMLKLHSLIYEKAGQGCVMRVLTDRKTV